MKHIRSMKIKGIADWCNAKYTDEDARITLDVSIKSQGVSKSVRGKVYEKQLFLYFHSTSSEDRKGIDFNEQYSLIGYCDIINRADKGYLTASQIKVVAKKLLDNTSFCVLILKRNKLAIALRDIAYNKEVV